MNRPLRRSSSFPEPGKGAWSWQPAARRLRAAGRTVFTLTTGKLLAQQIMTGTQPPELVPFHPLRSPYGN